MTDRRQNIQRTHEHTANTTTEIRQTGSK